MGWRARRWEGSTCAQGRSCGKCSEGGENDNIMNENDNDESQEGNEIWGCY